MIYFKNEILADIKSIENNFNKRISQINDLIKSNSEEYNAKFTKYSTLITELIEIVSNRKHDYEKMEELFQMKNSIWTQINENKNKLIIVTKDLENAVFKYDRIILDNLEFPGIVGNRCKFKNMKELYEFIYNEIKVEQLFREEQIIGNKKYKERIETLINNLNLRSAEIYQACNNICLEKLKNFENSINKRCETTEGLLEKLRLENSEYAMELKERVERINIDWEKLQRIKNETYERIDEELKKFNKIVEKNNIIFNSNKNEFKLIKQKFTQLSEFIRDVRFQKNLISHRKSIFSKEANNINFKKKQELQKDDFDNDDSFYINNDKNQLNESYDINSMKDKKENAFNSIFNSPDKNNHISSTDLAYGKKFLSSVRNKKPDIKPTIIFEIEGNKKSIKNLKKTSYKNTIKKEIELSFLADSLNAISSSSISDKEELYPKTERMVLTKFNFENININNHLNNDDEKKIDKLEEKEKYNEDSNLKVKSGKKLKLKALDFSSIENKKSTEKNEIKTEKEKNNFEIKEYSYKTFTRNNKNHKTDFTSVKGKHISEFDINPEIDNKKLLLTETTQCKKDNENSFDNDNENKNNNLKTQNNEENKYNEYPKISRHSSITTKKISVNTKDINYQLYSNKKLKLYDNYINKNDENINKIITKVDFLQNKYIPLMKKISDLFNMLKKLNNKVTENKLSINQLQKKNKEDKNSTQNDYNLFLNKTVKKRNNKYSFEVHNKNKNFLKKDNLDISNKNKLPNDQANIILRKIEPFLIKEFKKKNY